MSVRKDAVVFFILCPRKDGKPVPHPLLSSPDALNPSLEIFPSVSSHIFLRSEKIVCFPTAFLHFPFPSLPPFFFFELDDFIAERK